MSKKVTDFYREALPCFLCKVSEDGAIVQVLAGTEAPLKVGGLPAYCPTTELLRGNRTGKAVINPIYESAAAAPSDGIKALIGSAAIHLNLQVFNLVHELLKEAAKPSSESTFDGEQSTFFGGVKVTKNAAGIFKKLVEAWFVKNARNTFLEITPSRDVAALTGKPSKGCHVRFPMMEFLKSNQESRFGSDPINEKQKAMYIAFCEFVLQGSESVMDDEHNGVARSNVGWSFAGQGVSPFWVSAIKAIDAIQWRLRAKASLFPKLFDADEFGWELDVSGYVSDPLLTDLRMMVGDVNDYVVTETPASVKQPVIQPAAALLEQASPRARDVAPVQTSQPSAPAQKDDRNAVLEALERLNPGPKRRDPRDDRGYRDPRDDVPWDTSDGRTRRTDDRRDTRDDRGYRDSRDVRDDRSWRDSRDSRDRRDPRDDRDSRWREDDRGRDEYYARNPRQYVDDRGPARGSVVDRMIRSGAARR